jgi:hypothetical protein
MALPTPTRVSCISDSGDGGSLDASFYDGDGTYFTLRLDVRTAHGAPDIDVAGSAPPVLERRVPHLYTDKFTGGHHGYETSEAVTLDWEDAERLVASLARLPVETPAERDAELLARMARGIAARGVLARTP